MSEDALRELHALLVRRLAVIADHALRTSDPDAQLAQLRDVSERIGAWHAGHRASLPPRLNHFLTGASFDKARLWIEETLKA